MPREIKKLRRRLTKLDEVQNLAKIRQVSALELSEGERLIPMDNVKKRVLEYLLKIEEADAARKLADAHKALVYTTARADGLPPKSLRYLVKVRTALRENKPVPQVAADEYHPLLQHLIEVCTVQLNPPEHGNDETPAGHDRLRDPVGS